METVNAYKSRTFDEDIMYIKNELGGLEGLTQKLRVDTAKGLSNNDQADLDKRDAQFGSNYKPPPKRTPFCTFFIAAMDDFMLKILICCAFLSITIDMSFADAEHRKMAWVEGTAILIAVFVVSSVGAYNDWAKDAQFVKLQKISEDKQKITIMRDGVEAETPFNNIKVGDVAKIKNGMDIPVDGVIIYASGV